ncbi:hypothetical protein DYB32_003464 [Aphanomyces invadans]|uniref:Uncharacterized protein n=1 Tax=Aphanomyces invadans TaxID=157072 RepID=A0A3R6Z138_9STRA|nr:hypothetical protein DYB32_003464 [Aphanomyces invadans]
MAAVNVNAFKPVEAQLVLSLDDLIKQRREANKYESKAAKKGDVAKSGKQSPSKAKKAKGANTNATPLAKKKKQTKKVVAKPATQEVSATTLTPNQRKRLRKKRSKAASAGDDKTTDTPKKVQNNNQPMKQQSVNQPNKHQPNQPKKQQTINQLKKKQPNNQPKKQQPNNQPKKQLNQPSQQTQQKKRNVQIKVHRGNGGTLQKTISPSNNKTKSTQNQDKRNVLFNVTMNGVKGLSLGKKNKGNKEHPVKRLLGNHLVGKGGKYSAGKGGVGKPKMALKRRGNKKAT